MEKLDSSVLLDDRKRFNGSRTIFNTPKVSQLTCRRSGCIYDRCHGITSLVYVRYYFFVGLVWCYFWWELDSLSMKRSADIPCIYRGRQKNCKGINCCKTMVTPSSQMIVTGRPGRTKFRAYEKRIFRCCGKNSTLWDREGCARERLS